MIAWVVGTLGFFFCFTTDIFDHNPPIGGKRKDKRGACLTLLGPAAAKRQHSGAPATRSVAGGAAAQKFLNFFEMGHNVRQRGAAPRSRQRIDKRNGRGNNKTNYYTASSNKSISELRGNHRDSLRTL